MLFQTCGPLMWKWTSSDFCPPWRRNVSLLSHSKHVVKDKLFSLVLNVSPIYYFCASVKGTFLHTVKQDDVKGSFLWLCFKCFKVPALDMEPPATKFRTHGLKNGTAGTGLNSQYLTHKCVGCLYWSRFLLLKIVHFHCLPFKFSGGHRCSKSDWHLLLVVGSLCYII